MKTTRVGIIGCGEFALAQHLPNCAAARNIDLWHCLSRSEQGRKNAEKYKAKNISADYKDVLNDPQVDMVILSVPHEWHKF